GSCSYIPPPLHPVVGIASDLDYLRFRDCDSDLSFESRLSQIDDRVDIRLGMDIVQDAIRIDDNYCTAGGKNYYMRNVLKPFLVESDGPVRLQGLASFHIHYRNHYVRDAAIASHHE